MNLKKEIYEVYYMEEDFCYHFTYLKDANSMGFISTNPFTITEQSEKNNDDNVAKTMPRYGQFSLFLMRMNQRLDKASLWRKPSTN